jgi:hypothetical protein
LTAPPPKPNAKPSPRRSATFWVDSENLDFLHSRRHLATARDGKWRDLKYVIEFDEFRQRDGIKISKEVADRLIGSIAGSC